jgi:hypothetical protein
MAPPTSVAPTRPPQKPDHVFFGLTAGHSFGPPRLRLALSALGSVLSQGGDLAESALKRACGAKDSGRLIRPIEPVAPRTETVRVTGSGPRRARDQARRARARIAGGRDAAALARVAIDLRAQFAALADPAGGPALKDRSRCWSRRSAVERPIEPVAPRTETVRVTGSGPRRARASVPAAPRIPGA